jgi:hypothetical protein
MFIENGRKKRKMPGLDEAFGGEPQPIGIDSAKLSGKPSNYSVTHIEDPNNIPHIRPESTLRA